MLRRPPRSTQSRSSAASDVYKRQDRADPTVAARGPPRLRAPLHGPVDRGGEHVPDGPRGCPGRAARAARVSGALTLEVVTSPEQLDAAFAIRVTVFVGEQHVPLELEKDPADAEPGTVHILALLDGTPVGAGRLLPPPAPTGVPSRSARMC